MSSILITGGTGFLGHVLVRRLLAGEEYGRITVLSRDEWKQAVMREEFPDRRLQFLLGDVRDRDRLRWAFQGVQHVIHAAALKRVDAVAGNPFEVLATNVQGSANVCLAAVEAGVEKVVLVSTDKAVHSTNIYGTSKQFAEQLTIHANAIAWPRGTRLCAVRYGNVVGSRGSVLEVWARQAAEGRPLTVTHEEMTRFWITPERAVEFVLTAIPALVGGEILIPRLTARRIADVARELHPGASLHFQGRLRPGGEKLHEELLSQEEVSRTLEGRDFFLVIPHPCSWCDAAEVWRGQLVRPDFVYRSDLCLA